MAQPELPAEAQGVALVVLGAGSILDGDLDAGRAQCATAEGLVHHSEPELTWVDVMWAGAEIGAGADSAAAERALIALRRARRTGQREVLPWLLQISGVLAHRFGRTADGASLLATAASRKRAWGWRMAFLPVDAAADGLGADGPIEDLVAAVARGTEVLESIVA